MCRHIATNILSGDFEKKFCDDDDYKGWQKKSLAFRKRHHLPGHCACCASRLDIGLGVGTDCVCDWADSCCVVSFHHDLISQGVDGLWTQREGIKLQGLTHSKRQSDYLDIHFASRGAFFTKVGHIEGRPPPCFGRRGFHCPSGWLLYSFDVVLSRSTMVDVKSCLILSLITWKCYENPGVLVRCVLISSTVHGVNTSMASPQSWQTGPIGAETISE